MKKINKDYNLKIASLLITVMFLFNSVVYGIDLSKNTHLRVPVGNYDRINRVLNANTRKNGPTQTSSELSNGKDDGALNPELFTLMQYSLNGSIAKFLEWLDKILSQTEDLSEDQLKRIGYELGISKKIVDSVYARTIPMANFAYDFSKHLPDDEKYNVFLFRDSFALYAAEKIAGKPAYGLYLSKSTFRKFLGIDSPVADLIIMTMANEAAKEMGLLAYNGIPESKSKEFRIRFFNLMEKLLKNENIENIKNKELLDYRHNLRQAAEYLWSYLYEIGINEDEMFQKGIRFIDTTQRGTLVLFMEGLVRIKLKEKGIAEEDIDQKIDGRMCCSLLLPDISFVASLDEARVLESSFYPIEFGRTEQLSDKGIPIVKETGGNNKIIFLLQVSILRNQLRSLLKDKNEESAIESAAIARACL